MPPLPRDEAIRRLTEYQDRLDEARKAGTASYDTTFAQSPAGIGVHEIDAAKVLRRVNPEELRLLGYGEAQMLGRPVWEFIVMQEASKRAIDDKLSGGRELKPFVRTFKRADGSPVAMLLVDRLLKDGKGQVVGIRTAMTETSLQV
jgi:PAS domain S-box-containing protein